MTPPSRHLAAALFAAALLTTQGCSESSNESSGSSPNEQACAGWRDLLLQEPRPTDASVAARLGELLELGPTGQVEAFMIALKARLEDGVDISRSFAGLSDACGL